MKHEAWNKVKGFFRRGALAAVLALSLLAVISAYDLRALQAQPLPYVNPPPVLGGGCVCCKGCAEPCVDPGTASSIRANLVAQLYDYLEQSSIDIETAIGEAVDTMVEAILKRLNQMELDIIDFWETMWYYNLRPGMQNMAEQLNTAVAEQSRAFQGAIDSEQESQTGLEYKEQEAKAQRKYRPSESVCAAGTVAGGQGRATTFSRAMRSGWQAESLAIGSGKAGTPAASGASSAEKIRHDEYEALFCDPDDNGGNNNCAGDPNYYNADVQPARIIYDDLTIDVDDDPKIAASVRAVTDNMVGTPSADHIPEGVMKSAGGQEKWLDRRSFLARHAAVRSVPQMVAGARMPGSNMEQWVRELRQEAGIPLAEISDNPSYREVVHAVAIDRFNSGHYAVGMITDETEIEMEKLTLNTFYLMQLRDYFELLERQALTLAVQVSIMADQAAVPETDTARPLK